MRELPLFMYVGSGRSNYLHKHSIFVQSVTKCYRACGSSEHVQTARSDLSQVLKTVLRLLQVDSVVGKVKSQMFQQGGCIGIAYRHSSLVTVLQGKGLLNEGFILLCQCLAAHCVTGVAFCSLPVDSGIDDSLGQELG